MTEVTPHPLKTQGFHHFFILLFYDHPAKGSFFVCSAYSIDEPPVTIQQASEAAVSAPT